MRYYDLKIPGEHLQTESFGALIAVYIAIVVLIYACVAALLVWAAKKIVRSAVKDVHSKATEAKSEIPPDVQKKGKSKTKGLKEEIGFDEIDQYLLAEGKDKTYKSLDRVLKAANDFNKAVSSVPADAKSAKKLRKISASMRPGLSTIQKFNKKS